MQSIIKVNNLCKDYTFFEKEEGLRGSLRSLFTRQMQSRRAVDDFSFTIDNHDIVGLIGPNGAGKTTLIKMLTGIVKPTSGGAVVLGYDPAHAGNEYKRRFALVMGQKSQLWWDLPAGETFRLNQAIYQIEEGSFLKNVHWLTELFEVVPFLKVPVRQLSLGERMKMEIIASLLHDPSVLFLDEPTIGLDAIAQRQIRDLLRQVNREKKVTILLTSHYMKDIHSLCERVIVIRQGRKIYDGQLERLLEQYKESVNIHLRFNQPTQWSPTFSAQPLEMDAYHAVYQVPKSETQRFLHSALTACDLADMRVEEKELDELVETIYSMEGETE
ncbi:MAG: ATP-binding cassette domain-containing protein [Anaerolineae bacterium]|nr:ATP-binding cassette domain-containing protein [Anaerolineae bacterium]